MSSAQFPDGHREEVHGADLKEIFDRAEDAIGRGAISVRIYPEPHGFVGQYRRCRTCGCMPDDEIHSQPEPERTAAS